MLTIQQYDQWLALAGYLLILLFFLIFIAKDFYKLPEIPKWEKTLVFLLFLLAIIAPFLIIPNDTEKILMRSGKIADTFVFILFYYIYRSRSLILQKIPAFFKLWYSLSIFFFCDMIVTSVLLSGKYEFYKILLPKLEILGINNFTFLSPINYLIKFVFLGLFFRDILKEPTWKKAFQYIIWALIVFEFIMVFGFKSYQAYDSVSSTVKNFFILLGSGLFLYRFYRTDSGNLHLQKNPYFWIGIGLFLPTLTEMFMEFVFTKLFHTDIDSFFKYYLYRNASQIIGFMLFIYGVWQAKYLKHLPNEY